MPEAERRLPDLEAVSSDDDGRWSVLQQWMWAGLSAGGAENVSEAVNQHLLALRSEYEAMRDLLGHLVAALNTDGLTDYDDIDEIGDEAAALLNLERRTASG